MCIIGNAQHYFIRLILLFLTSANSVYHGIFGTHDVPQKWVFSHHYNYNGPTTPTATLSHSTIMDDCCDIPLSPSYHHKTRQFIQILHARTYFASTRWIVNHAYSHSLK